jgi:hypothetical protein
MNFNYRIGGRKWRFNDSVENIFKAPFVFSMYNSFYLWRNLDKILSSHSFIHEANGIVILKVACNIHRLTSHNLYQRCTPSVLAKKSGKLGGDGTSSRTTPDDKQSHKDELKSYASKTPYQ